jgi:non-heme chloroperoxidase
LCDSRPATANLNPWTEAKVDTKNPDRGPLLLISGERDHTVPWAIVNASYKQQQDNQGVTEIELTHHRGGERKPSVMTRAGPTAAHVK